jgi:hypothetical protein
MKTIEFTDEEIKILSVIIGFIKDKINYNFEDFEKIDSNDILTCSVLLWRHEIDFNMFKNIESKIDNY